MYKNKFSINAESYLIGNAASLTEHLVIAFITYKLLMFSVFDNN